MNQAQFVISKFGGVRPAARALDEWPNTITRWLADGFIPSDRHPKILELSMKNDLGITATNLIFPPADAEGLAPLDKQNPAPTT